MSQRWIELNEVKLISIHETYLHIIIWRFEIIIFMSTFLRSRFSKELLRNSCLILGVKLFQMNAFCIFCISSIIYFENEVINVRYTTLDSVNILKIFIFPSSVIFLILHRFKTFCLLVIIAINYLCIYNFRL